MHLYLSRHSYRLDRIEVPKTKVPDTCLHWSGVSKIIEQREKIKWIDYIFSSPFLRCVQTAYHYNKFEAPIYLEYGLAEILFPRFFDERPTLDKNLKRHYHTIDECYNSYIKEQEYIFPETREDQKNRVYKFLDWLQTSQYWNKNILLVGHGGSIKLCLKYFGIENPDDPKMGELHSIEM
mgnify:FL=1